MSHAVPMSIDHELLQARRRQVVATMAGRPGQVSKSKEVKDFDIFVHASAGGRRGWEAATPDNVFDWFCFLDTHGNGTTIAHAHSCSGVGSTGWDACAPGAACAERYAAGSLRRSFYSKLRMAYGEQPVRGDAWKPTYLSGNPCDSKL